MSGSMLGHSAATTGNAPLGGVSNTGENAQLISQELLLQPAQM